MASSKKRFRTRSRLSQVLGLTVAILAVGGAALVGIQALRGSSAYTGNHSACQANDAYVSGHKVTSVQINQSFAAIVKFFNDGSTTWSPDYGFYVGQSNGDGTNWQPNGGNFTQNYPPGTTASFLIGVKAPSSTGSKNFNWKIGIVYQGQFNSPCNGTLQVVYPPPSTPTLSVTGVTSSSISLSWSSTSYTKDYTLFRNNNALVTQGGTTYKNTGLSCHTTYSYFVRTNGLNGSATNSNTVSKTTSACPSGGGGGGGGSGGGGSSGGGSSSGNTTQPPDGSSTNTQNEESTGITEENTGSTEFGSDVGSLSPGQTGQKAPLWRVLLKILLVLVILAGVGFAGLILVSRYLLARKQKAVYNDYRKKSQGL